MLHNVLRMMVAEYEIVDVLSYPNVMCNPPKKGHQLVLGKDAVSDLPSFG